MNWLKPWRPTGDNVAEEQALEWRLFMEVGPGHPLFGIRAKLIGRHDGSDDALFRLMDGSARVAVVHLTWIGRQEEPPFPLTDLYASLDDWAIRRMRPDHEKFIS
jgi:hypothetical protein